VLEQLRAGGVLEAVRIACAGGWVGNLLHSMAIYLAHRCPAVTLTPMLCCAGEGFLV